MALSACAFSEEGGGGVNWVYCGAVFLSAPNSSGQGVLRAASLASILKLAPIEFSLISSISINLVVYFNIDNF